MLWGRALPGRRPWLEANFTGGLVCGVEKRASRAWPGGGGLDVVHICLFSVLFDSLSIFRRLGRMGTKDSVENWYLVLGIKETATEKEISTAYRKGALKCHPDRFQNDKAASERFLKLSKAMEVLQSKSKYMKSKF